MAEKHPRKGIAHRFKEMRANQRIAKIRKLAVVEASPDELAAIRRGRAEIKRGQYVTLDQLVDELAASNRKASTKRA